MFDCLSIKCAVKLSTDTDHTPKSDGLLDYFMSHQQDTDGQFAMTSELISVLKHQEVCIISQDVMATRVTVKMSSSIKIINLQTQYSRIAQNKHTSLNILMKVYYVI